MSEFKKLSETEIVEAPGENDTIVLVSDGEVKRVSAAAFAAAAGGGGGGAEPIRLINKSTGSYYETDYTLDDGSAIPSNLYDLYLAGVPILICDCYCEAEKNLWYTVIGAQKVNSTNPYCNFTFYDFNSSAYKSLMVSIE